MMMMMIVTMKRSNETKRFSIGLSDLYNINGKSSFPMEEPLANSRTPFTAGVVSRKSIQLPKNLILSWSFSSNEREIHS